MAIRDEINKMYAESLQWLDDNLVVLTAHRDVSKGTFFLLDFNTSNGCTAAVSGESIQECVRKAREMDPDLEKGR